MTAEPEKKGRVSAKQRLEIIKKAWADFKYAVEPDIDKLEEDIKRAFGDDLSPKSKK